MNVRKSLRKFPLLQAMRKKQRIACFYAAMRLDHNRYASGRLSAALPHLLFESRCPLYNRETGFDMVFQQNKVFNLKLAAAVLDGVVIRPGETFSFWHLVRRANRNTPYQDGLVVIDGRLTTASGGGVCQMSNSLFWMFLHTPLTIVERHGHAVKDFPEPPSDALKGVDATIAEGWLDLKVKNDTQMAYQVSITFDEESIIGRVFSERDEGCIYKAVNGPPHYHRENGKIFEQIDVFRAVVSSDSGALLSRELLYQNRCEIRYPLPEDTKFEQKEG